MPKQVMWDNALQVMRLNNKNKEKLRGRENG